MVQQLLKLEARDEGFRVGCSHFRYSCPLHYRMSLDCKLMCVDLWKKVVEKGFELSYYRIRELLDCLCLYEKHVQLL